MLKLLKALKHKLISFFQRKTLLEKIDNLEIRVAKLEAQNKKLKKEQKTLVLELKNDSSPTKKDKKEAPTKGKTNSKQQMVDEMLEKVMGVTGWDYNTTKAAYHAARKRTGCTAKEFYLYRMYDMTDAEQDTVLVASIQHKLHTKYGVNGEFVKLIRDKEKTNDFFAEYVRRPWCVNTKVSFQKFCRVFANTRRIIYKPLGGNRGFGVEAFDLNSDNMQEIYDRLATYPVGVVEQYVVQHPEMLRLCPSSVNTIRVVTFSSNTQPVTADGKYMDIAYTALRIGGGGSIVDNFHSGGMVSIIDLESGKLITDAADMECNVFTHHPATGVEIKGFQIPYYKEALAMVTEAVTKNKLEGYLGWDIAIAEDGPLLIEVNNRPGVVLLSTPYAAQKIGMKHVLAKYL